MTMYMPCIYKLGLWTECMDHDFFGIFIHTDITHWHTVQTLAVQILKKTQAESGPET